MIKSRIKKTVFVSAAVVLASIALGRYVIVPLTVFKASWSVEFACGLLALGCIAEFANVVTGVLLNMGKKIRAAAKLPKTMSDLRNMGIESPVDYAFAMCNMLAYKRTPVFLVAELLSDPEQMIFPAVLKNSMALFEQRFGRKPFGCETRDWDRILCLETAEVLKKDAEKVKVEEVLDQISGQVLERFCIKRIHGEEDKAA